jgi:hypothetical protein
LILVQRIKTFVPPMEVYIMAEDWNDDDFEDEDDDDDDSDEEW